MKIVLAYDTRRSRPPLVSRAMNLRDTSKGYPNRPCVDDWRRLEKRQDTGPVKAPKGAGAWSPQPYSTRLELAIFLSSLSVRLLRLISCPLPAVVLIVARLDNVEPNPSSASQEASLPEAVSKRISA